MRVRRLAAGERDVARRLFTLIAEVFDEGCEPLSDAYVDRLLAREDSGRSRRSRATTW